MLYPSCLKNEYLFISAVWFWLSLMNLLRWYWKSHIFPLCCNYSQILFLMYQMLYCYTLFYFCLGLPHFVFSCLKRKIYSYDSYKKICWTDVGHCLLLMYLYRSHRIIYQYLYDADSTLWNIHGYSFNRIYIRKNRDMANALFSI